MITREVYVTKVYDFIRDTKARVVILKGGAGSSKSYSLAQHFILNKMLSGEDLVNVVIRKTLPALKKTAFKLIIDLLKEYEIPYSLNKTDLELRVKNSITYFLSLDEPEKIKSLTINNAWLEESTELNLEDFRQIKLRLRRENKGINQIYCSFNPTSALHWIKTEVVDKADDDVAVNTSTYRDNPFLDKLYIKDLEDLINEDQNFYKIYNLGEWGVLENIIYSNWKTYDNLPEKIDYVTYACDWGFNHPSVITEINWVDGKFIAKELFYGGGRTQVELVEEAKKVIPEEFRKREMYIDSAEPGLILSFWQEGFNSHKAKKDVNDGISYVKTHMLGVTKDSINGIKELSSYSWKKDKNDNVIDTPIDFKNDFCDTIRYGSFSHDYGNATSSNVW